MTLSDDAPEHRLALRTPDYLASAARAVLGAAPFVGNLLGELVGTVVPNQREERIVKFAIELENRLSSLEERALQDLRTNENFSELLEEGFRQAARSLTDERRAQIASLIANSLPPEAIAHEESRHLLRIFGDVNDIEIIWLQYFGYRSRAHIDAFREKHPSIVRPISRSRGQPQGVVDKAALQDSYKQHLVQLGLLSAELTRSRGGSQRVNHQITSLGRLLLRQIGTEREDTG